MTKAHRTFAVAGPVNPHRICRVCNHAVSRVGVMPSGHCGLHGCEDRGWHWHCGQRHSVCTAAGCYPRDEAL
jgi:hypothetical protein